MASEAKQETNRSDPDVVRLGPKFAPGTWFWQEAPEPARKGARAKPPRWVQYEQEQANRLEWCHQAGVQRVVFWQPGGPSRELFALREHRPYIFIFFR